MKTTKIQQNGTPRTKGIRNALVLSAIACKGGPMRDRRERRVNDARRSWKKEEW